MKRLLPLLLLAGCASQLTLTRDQLFAVAGLPERARRTVYTNHGSFTIDGRQAVSVITKDGPLPAAPLEKMEREGEALVVKAPDAAPVKLQRQDVVRAEATSFSASRSIALATAIAGGLAFVYVVIVGLAL